MKLDCQVWRAGSKKTLPTRDKEVVSPVVVPRDDRRDALLAHQDDSKGDWGVAGWSSAWRDGSPRAAFLCKWIGVYSQGLVARHDHSLITMLSLSLLAAQHSQTPVCGGWTTHDPS